MVHLCHKCRRANPPGAVYCYHDGIVLDGHAAPRPVAVGSRPLPHPFVFPSGHSCQTLEELALSCQGNWKQARDLLQQGVFKSYLSHVGRADLAGAADKAARFPDADRGLDQFLAALPCDRLAGPRLEVRPLEMNLGVLPPGRDRQFTLELRNTGMRLVYGSFRSENAPWLSVGDAPEAFFEFTEQKSVSVFIRGKLLSASVKPLEGRLVFDSSGGTQTVVVRTEVPVQPFPEGTLSGATSPRQVAEKAKLYPKEAAVYFESGAVARWYTSNGWSYPVRGPAASGLGAVQQFFEALGLAKPPRVEISARNLLLRYPNLSATLEARTTENRPIYASATSNQPWLHIGAPTIKGRVVTIPLSVPAIPDASAPTRATVQVSANGNQRFDVTVDLADLPPRPRGQGAPYPGVVAIVEPVRVATVVPVEPVRAAGPAYPTSGGVGEPVRIRGRAGDNVQPAPPVRRPEVLPEVVPVDATTARPAGPAYGPLPVARPAEQGAYADDPEPIRAPEKSGCALLLLHLIPVALLGMMLAGFVVRDLNQGPAGPAVAAGNGGQMPAWVEAPVAIDPKPRIRIEFDDHTPTMRFGISTVPTAEEAGGKQLTFKKNGLSNNTCLRVDGGDVLFGTPILGRFTQLYDKEWRDSDGVEHKGGRSVWVLNSPAIRVTQTVEIVPGSVVREKEKLTRLMDTCLVRYEITNDDSAEHDVGLRFLLDTLIGKNDGVPFLFPDGASGCDTSKVFTGPDVPEYLLAVENDLESSRGDPGTVAKIQFNLGKRFAPASSVTLGAWPDPRLIALGHILAKGQFTLWEVPVASIPDVGRIDPRAKPDSAVTIYWSPRSLAPGETRAMGFTYGLGSIATSPTGQLAVIGAERARVEQEFTVQAIVRNPAPDQKLTLEVPKGAPVSVSSTTPATQDVPPVPAGATRADSTVTWRLRGTQPGSFTLTVRSSTGLTQVRLVVIEAGQKKDFWDR